MSRKYLILTKANDPMHTASVHGFDLIRTERIEELHSTAFQFEHRKSGAHLIHLHNDDPNNLFSIAFRTPVYDNTGVPHILEHSVLGGSRKYPIKDPFQELLKGSLQTFLNALTYPDKTVYPVSSQVESDFYNLADVYCDAVFHPLLTEQTFFQEGWHFDVPDPDGPITIKGIVYNEMKGVFSDFHSHVSRKTIGALFPDTTYYFESGGEPEFITDLTYEQFKQFHSRFYHPSNSYIFLYGNIPAEKTCAFLDKKYLDSFTRIEPDSHISPQPLWNTPHRVEFDAPAAEHDKGTATVLVTWLTGTTTDPVDMLICRILSRYLLGTESSPLRRALVDSGLGEDLDEMTGFDAELVQGIFTAGLRKAKPENTTAITNLIFSTLKNQADGGIDEELLEASIRRTEFSLREISDDGRFPYNLRLADRCYRSWIYDGDPFAHLAFEQPLSTIKADPGNHPHIFAGHIKRLLIDNPHYLVTTVTASPKLGQALEHLTENQTRRLTENFTHDDKKKHYTITKGVLEVQKKPVTNVSSIIPRLRIGDVPQKNRIVPCRTSAEKGIECYHHDLFTSGIVYVDIGFDCLHIPPPLLPYLPIYLELLTRCGARDYSFEQMAKRVSLSTGGISSSTIIRETFSESSSPFLFKLFIHSKSIVDRAGEMATILTDLFTTPHLDNRKQIKTILMEMKNDLYSSIIGSGHSFAVNYLCSRLTPSGYCSEVTDGITQFRFLDRLIRTDNIDSVIDAMKQLHTILIQNKNTILSITAEDPSLHNGTFTDVIGQLPTGSISECPLDTLTLPEGNFTGIEINTSVNYVAQGWRLEKMNAHELGLMNLLSLALSRGFLWDSVRVEGGAYGSMASISPNYPVFTCYSYRDPNLLRTLECFKEGLIKIAHGANQDMIEQSSIGTIGKIDKPRTPHQMGLSETYNRLSGKPPDFRQQQRDSILCATPKALTETAQRILDTATTAVCIVGSKAAFTEISDSGSSFIRQPLTDT
jgi:hypothetical protein